MTRIKSGTQRARLLIEFVNGRRLHRFQAEALGCHALHSLVSGYESDGLRFDRRTVEIPGRWGTARVTEYWLAQESVPQARRLLGMVEPASCSAADYLKASEG